MVFNVPSHALLDAWVAPVTKTLESAPMENAKKADTSQSATVFVVPTASMAAPHAAT
jgi:hypothetical protein